MKASGGGSANAKRASARAQTTKLASTASSSGIAALGGMSCIYLTLFICAAFFLGLKVGSIFVHTHGAPNAASMQKGLPGTNNVLQSWSTTTSLRGSQEQASTGRSGATTSRLRAVTPTTSAKATSSTGPKPTTPTLGEPVTLLPLAHTPAQSAAQVPTPGDGKEHEASFQVDRRSFVEGPTDLDESNVLVSAWIFLDDNPVTDNDMRTVFSNKMPGCEHNEGQHGISMFVNGWQQPDHKLYIEFGSHSSGCNKLDSNRVTLLPQRWYHVAAFFGQQESILYVDGTEVSRLATLDPHIPQTRSAMLLGHYSLQEESSYPLYGNISGFSVVHTTTPSESLVRSLQTAASARVVDGIKAFFPLGDATPASLSARDIITGKTARCELPLSGQQVSGVPITLVDGRSTQVVTEDMIAESDRLGRERRESVKDGMRHAWKAYRQHAWGRDELRPISGSARDNWGGMGVTLVDALDTLWVMGLKDEFYEAQQWVQSSLSFARAGSVSVFETTIRELGGLLAAYDLSKERIFLDKAKDLADRLLPAFSTPSGIPVSHISLNSGGRGAGWSGGSAVLSEMGTLQVEFRYLSHALGEPKYADISMKALRRVLQNNPSSGLYPIHVSIQDGRLADATVTFGALGDSFYEYLLKLWIQGGKTESYLREAYDKAIDGAIQHMLLASSKSGLAFLSDWDGHRNNRKMDHLVCFMPGLLTLGAYTCPEGLDSRRAQRDLSVARALMYTCREMYHRTATGISPEYVRFPERGDMEPGFNAEYYILRPETAESLFVMSQLTKDPIYRQWAWEIWQSIDKVLRTPLGYASLHNVNNANSLEDRMESFFFAETLKYLYLAQDPDRPVDLSKVVFNTEAHPLSSWVEGE